jgi:benzodiazapine receptor
MHKDILRQWVNVLAVVVTIAVNGLANALPINGQQTGAISDRFPVFFVPAGYVFSIWGLIYLGLIAFAVYQVLPAQRTNPRLQRVGYWFALSCLANTVWILLWHYNMFPASLLVMLVLLASLMVIYLRLDIGRTAVSTAEKWAVNVPFSIYLGWITVAAVANATDVLYDLKWTGFGISPELWAVLMILAATIICLAVILTRRDVAYSLVIIWALIGIAQKQGDRSQAVATMAVGMAVVIAVALIVVKVGLARRKTV